MTREEFYKEICKLAPSEYDASKCDFRKHLDDLLDKYIELLWKFDEAERPMDWDNIIKKNNQLIEAIKESVRLYYEGRHTSAFRHLSKYIGVLKSVINVRIQDLYRMRMFDEGEKHDCNGMFHIPFNKRTIVKTQRYSAPGYPCLYLGKSAYVCWEEMLRPNLDKCYVSRFRTKKDIILVYDLSLPTYSRRVTNYDFWLDLLRLPLILACMVKVAKPKDPFKPEYIIPQFIMEWVIEARMTKKDLMGILYTSVHKSNDFKFASEKLENVAIPVFFPFKGKYSKKLCNLFQLTEPTCDELERAKCPYQAIERDEKMTDLEYKYRISTFGQLEARLKDETKFPLEKIDSK